MAVSLRTSGVVQEQSASPSAQHIVWGSLGESSNAYQHIVWGCVSSSGSNNESSSFNEQRITDDVLVLGADNAFSESTSDQNHVEPAEDEEAEGHKASLQMTERIRRTSHGSVIRNLDKFLDEDEKQRDAYLLLAKQSLTNKGLDAEELLPQVPLDEFGRYTSIGSIGHSNQLCKDPCVFINHPSGCANGVACGFCHFHTARRKRVKDGKLQRDRYRKLKQAMMQETEKAPYDDLLERSLPAWIDGDGWLKEKLMKSLKAHQETLQKTLVDL